jgi:hypothetical protein
MRQTSCYLHLSLIAAAAVIFTPTVGAQETRNSDHLSIRESLLADWKTLETWDEAERSFHTESETLLPDGKTVPRSLTVKMRPGHRLIATPNALFSRSNDYAFNLLRTDGEWKMNYFTLQPLSPESLSFERGAMTAVDKFSMNPLSAHNLRLRLHELIADVDFVITRVERQKDGLERIEYKHKKAAGHMLVDRQNSSIVLETSYRETFEKYGEIAYEIKRQFFSERSAGNIPRCRTFEHTTRRATTNELLGHETLQFSDYSDAKVADKEFRLSNYGLPEPHGFDYKKRTPVYLWLLVAAAVFAVIAVALRCRRFIRLRRV